MGSRALENEELSLLLAATKYANFASMSGSGRSSVVKSLPVLLFSAEAIETLEKGEVAWMVCHLWECESGQAGRGT